MSTDKTKIIIHSLTFRARVDGVDIERTFTPAQHALPGILKEAFSAIRFYLFHNPRAEQIRTAEAERPAFIKKIMD